MALYAAAAATTATALHSIAVSFCKKMACLDAILFRKRSRGGRGRAAVPVIVSLLEVESHSRTDGRVELQHIEFQFA